MMWMAFVELGILIVLVGFVIWAIRRKPRGEE